MYSCFFLLNFPSRENFQAQKNSKIAKKSTNKRNLPTCISVQRAFSRLLKSEVFLFSGRYVRAKDVSSEIDKREFVIDASMDTSLVTFVNRFLPMFANYSLIMRFIDEKSAFEFGQVNHALCGAIRSLMKEYLIFVAQVSFTVCLKKIKLKI